MAEPEVISFDTLKAIGGSALTDASIALPDPIPYAYIPESLKI